MTGSPLTQQERLTALLVDRATEGLDPRQLDELNELANAPPADAGIDDLLGDNGFDWAAAAVDLAWSPPADEPLPARLRDRVLTDAGKTLAELRRASLPAALAVDPVGATIPLRTPRPLVAGAVVAGRRQPGPGGGGMVAGLARIRAATGRSSAAVCGICARTGGLGQSTLGGPGAGLRERHR
jgi:hypothetical protein